MNRQIKFRQFYEGKFHFWGFVEKGSVRAFVSPILLRERSDQFTGLTDKNGKEIYEGDIIPGDRLKNGTPRNCWVVEWITNNKKVGWSIAESKKVEVIGNIYENPELLK